MQRWLEVATRRSVVMRALKTAAVVGAVLVAPLLAALLLAARAAEGAGLESLVRDGDIVFHTSRSAQSLAIQRATKSPYSHMGVVLFRAGRPFVLEAVSTVRYTPFGAWVKRGDGGRVVVKRLRDADAVLTTTALDALRREAKRLEGKPYDLTFEWSDRRIYCSELVYKLFDRALGVKVGALAKLRDFDLSHPAVKAKMRERYGANVPLDETVVSPAAMFDDARLVTIHSAT